MVLGQYVEVPNDRFLMILGQYGAGGWYLVVLGQYRVILVDI